MPTCNDVLQAKGSASRVLFELEDCYRQPKAQADRLPIIVPFNSANPSSTVALNQAQTITGDLNPTAPFRGNRDTTGNLTVPVDPRVMLHWMVGLFGTPQYWHDSPVTNYLIGTGVTVTVAAGVGTFTDAQTTAAENDRVILRNSAGVYFHGFLTAKTSDTIWDLDLNVDGATAVANGTYDVVAIIRNVASATPGTVTISSGVATFGTAQPNVAVGSLIVYNDDKKALVTAVTSTTVVSVIGANGEAVEDQVSTDLESIELDAHFFYEFWVKRIASIPSFALEMGFQDLSVPFYTVFLGCKVNSFEVSVGGDGELTANLAIIGADRQLNFKPYDVESTMAGSPTVNVTSATNVFVFSAAQADIAAGDYVVLKLSDGVYGRYQVVTVNSTTNFTMDSSPESDPTGLTVMEVYKDPEANSTARSIYVDRFENLDASAKEGGETVELFKSVSLTVARNLDTDNYVIGGGGVRVSLPEQIVGVSGSAEMLLTNRRYIEKAAEKQVSSIAVKLEIGTETMEFIIDEMNYQELSPSVDGPQGVVWSPEFMGFKSATGDSAIRVQMKSKEMLYA